MTGFMAKGSLLVLVSIVLCLVCGDRSQAAPEGPRPWRDYRTIMWIGEMAYRKPEKLPLFFTRLREMGINTGMCGGGSPRALLENNFPYYVENVVNRGLCLKWNSKVRDWEQFTTQWTRSGRPESAMVRDYCLDDPEWRKWARGEMETVAARHKAHQPLAYDIRDELSTTISANPFDYDFGPAALNGFREWLKRQYADLESLNGEWETSFGSWEAVKPFTTDGIKNRMSSGEALPRGQPDWQALQKLKFDPADRSGSRTRWNLAPWADFRTYMDVALARALDELRLAARRIDPATPVGIEGTQMPHAFGGYDLSRLSQVLDWAEPYDIGNAREIFGSFMPERPIMTTVFEKDTQHAQRRLWHLLLEGDRGCIIWWSEDCIDWKSGEYALTPKARALAPVLRELTSPLARLYLRAKRQFDPVWIHYSQASIQVDWLIESTVDGPSWIRRFSSFEAGHNRMVRVRNGWLRLVQDLGFSSRFVSSAQLEAGMLRNEPRGALVLPQSYALSDAEIREVRAFSSKAGRIVLADGTPGVFDEHGRLRASSPLASMFPAARSQTVLYMAGQHGERDRLCGDIAGLGAERAKGRPDPTAWRWLGKHLPEPWPRISPETRTRAYRYEVGNGQLAAFERNIDYHMSEELKQAGGNEALEKPVEVEAIMPAVKHVYDLRALSYLGHTDRIRFRLDPWQPSLFAMVGEKVPEKEIVAFLARGVAGD